MKRIFCIMGKSASGKDTIYNLVKKDFKNLSSVITYTTRPMRDGEIQNETYHFISIKEMNHLEKNGELIERRDYETVDGIWSYATGINCFNKNKDYLLITTPEAYGKMKEKMKDVKLIPIYIEADDDVRLIRSISREKKNGRKNYREICRRFLADEKDFNEKILEKLEIKNIFNNNENCLRDVEEFIKEQCNIAHWIMLTNCANEGIYCSECSKKVYKIFYDKKKAKSCPNCGRKMEEIVEKF